PAGYPLPELHGERALTRSMVPSGGGIPHVGPGGVLRVFLSHTAELRALPADRSFVAAAEAAVIRSGHALTDMAYFAAQDTAPAPPRADSCVAGVGEAHAYVGLIGHRYGTPVVGRADLSYTELEFETTSQLGLPRLIFLVRGDAGRRSFDEPAERAARQERFR